MRQPDGPRVKNDMSDDARKPTISFLVTALNEQENIEPTVATVRKAAEGMFSAYEVVLIDDGSTDRTGEIMDRLAREDGRVRVIHNERNLGLGGAYKRGVAAARHEYVMWISGDNAETAENIRKIVGQIGRADIVIPYLTVDRSRPWFRRLTSRSFVILVNFLFGLRLRYYNAPVIHRTELIRGVDISTNSFAYQAEALIKMLRAGRTYVEFGYTSQRYSGVFSNAMKPRNLIGVLKAVARLFVSERLRKKA